jgi:hypothetical protein
MAKDQKPQTQRKRRIPTIDPNESKSDKFRRLAVSRVPAALKAIGAIANLSGSGYEYTKEQVDKILNDLSERVEFVRSSFERGAPIKGGAAYRI